MASRTITIDAIGRREATPKFGRVEVTAIGEGDTAAVALAAAQDRAETIRESLTAISADQIKTVNFRVEDSSAMFDRDTDENFQATERINVECTPDAAETIVTEVTNAGGTIPSVHFYLQKSVRQELQNEALSAAMKRAKEKARHVATAENLAIGKVQEVTTEEVSTGMESIVDEALAASPDTDLHPSPVTVSEAVEVVYGLAEE